MKYKVHEYSKVNPFIPNAPFLNPWKQKTVSFLIFSGCREKCIENKWVEKIIIK